MQCCVSVAYKGVYMDCGREGFCDEVVGSRDPRGKGDTDVLGKSSLAGERR